MSNYRTRTEPWHDSLPVVCSCQPAWRERGMVDDGCYFHRLVDAVEELRGAGWTVELGVIK